MAVSILLLHRIAIFFGCPIKYKSLILCAVMAFLVNFATLNISPFLTPMHYGLIIIFVLTASLGVTFYNARLLKKERRTASEDIRGEPAEETPAEEPAQEPVADEVPAEEPAQEPAADEAPAEEPAQEPVADEAPAEEEELDDEDLDIEPAMPPSEEERQRAKEELKELTEAVGRLRSMDDYLDYADQEARAHRSRHAVFAYKQALGIYWNDDYAPFIAINLSNTYKDMGDYEAAVDTYEAALILPAAQKNAAMQQEFRRSIDYLRRVHDILASHGIADTPFAQIPPAISAEIENAGSKA